MPELTDDLRAEYQRLYNLAYVRPEFRDALEQAVAKIARYQLRYEAVSSPSLVPWQWIGCIHMMESDCNFSCHLHNGDPLTARTVHAPVGRPPMGDPPFYWHTSALDALVLKGLYGQQSWDTPTMLYQAERWNGFGYYNRQVPSPYLWAGSQHYEKGKYRKDHTWDPDAVSKQIGVGLLLKRLLQLAPPEPLGVT